MKKLTKIQEICKYRGLPMIKRFAKCEVDGKPGRIVGTNSSCNFNVKFDHYPEGSSASNCHPNWRMRIFNEDGSVLYQSKDD